MLYIRTIRPNLNTQSDSIRAKLFVQLLMLLLIYSFFRYICTRFHYLLSLDDDVLETSKRRAMFYNILSQNFIVKSKDDKGKESPCELVGKHHYGSTDFLDHDWECLQLKMLLILMYSEAVSWFDLNTCKFSQQAVKELPDSMNTLEGVSSVCLKPLTFNTPCSAVAILDICVCNICTIKVKSPGLFPLFMLFA